MRRTACRPPVPTLTFNENLYFGELNCPFKYHCPGRAVRIILLIAASNVCLQAGNCGMTQLAFYIGHPKTGTTALQFALDANRERLGQFLGILYPAAGKEHKHVVFDTLPYESASDPRHEDVRSLTARI